MAEDAAPRHAATLSSLNIVHEHNKLNHVQEFPLRKQGAVISLSASRDREHEHDDVPGDGTATPQRRDRHGVHGPARARKLRKISSMSVPEGRDATDAKDALVLLQNGNHGDTYFLAEDDAEDDDDEDDEDEVETEVGEDVDEDTGVGEGEGGDHRVPDGGWGWAVVAAAFFINMASDGISFSFGLLYIEFLRYFGESRSTTAWIGSLFMAVPMLTGPVASAMVDRYGCRAMTIVGGVISAIGFVIAASASTIGQMYLTFGVLAGLGLGLCFITAVVSIAYWFERKRTLALSLGAAGTGFGTFIYAPMTNYFISEYGWRGTVLLLAGTFLNLCVCGVVMRDPSWWAAEQRARRKGRGRRGLAGPGPGRSSTAMSLGGSAPGVLEVPSEASELLPLAPLAPLAIPLSRVARSLPYTRPIAMATRSEDNLAVGRTGGPLSPSTPISPGPLLFNPIPEHVHDEAAAGDATLPAPTPATTPPRPVMYLPLVPSTGSVAGAVAGVVAGAVHVPGHTRRPTPTTPFGSSPLRTESLPCFRRRVSLSTTPGTPLYATPGTPGTPLTPGAPGFPGPGLRRPSSKEGRSLWRSCCPGFLLPDGGQGKRWYSDTMELVRAMLDFSLFLELHFLLMSVGTALLYTWFVVPYFYLADHLIRNGYTEAEASRLLGVVGVANTAGMVMLGSVGDDPRLNVTKTYATCLAVCGTSTVAMLVFTDRYWLLVLACATFGVTFGSTFSFTPTILVTLVPMERFTTAYGLNLLCQGIGNLLGPPFAGWLFDLTDSWDWSFYMAGLWIVVAGFLTGLIAYTNNRHLFGVLPAAAGAEAPVEDGTLAAPTPSKSSSSIYASASATAIS